MPISVKLVLGLLVGALVTGALGLHAYRTIASIGTIAMDTYDKPLMAINFARAAETSFTKLYQDVSESMSSSATEPASAAESTTTFRGQLLAKLDGDQTDASAQSPQEPQV